MAVLALWVAIVPLPGLSATIAIDLPELLGRYEDGDIRGVRAYSIPTPPGDLLLGFSLRLEGRTDCPEGGCEPGVRLQFQALNTAVPEGEFDLAIDARGFEPFPLFSVFLFDLSILVGEPLPGSFPQCAILGGVKLVPTCGTNGSISYNGFFGVSAGSGPSSFDTPLPSSPLSITSATLILHTIPEPGVALLGGSALIACFVSRRFARM